MRQSFSDLVYSKDRALPAVAWHPARRGVVAVAVAEPLNLAAAGSGGGGGAGGGAVLLWDYRDPIHPEAVLAAPAGVLALAFNPIAPQWVAAGCLGGQVALWNLDQLALQREQVRPRARPRGLHGALHAGCAATKSQKPAPTMPNS